MEQNEKYTVLSCPHCGATKEVFNLVCANPFCKEFWSDFRNITPYRPVIFPIQKCQDCGNYYFIKPEQYHPVDIEAHVDILNFAELKEAYAQLHKADLSSWENEMICVELIKAYNDAFRRGRDDAALPSEKDRILFQQAADFLLNNNVEISKLFYAELLRETGRFEEAEALLRSLVNDEEYRGAQWFIGPVLDLAVNRVPDPILLVENGEPICG